MLAVFDYLLDEKYGVHSTHVSNAYQINAVNNGTAVASSTDKYGHFYYVTNPSIV